MRFTDNPFEQMMQERPRPMQDPIPQPRPGSPCRGCAYWQGRACIGTCYRKLAASTTSGQIVPKSEGDGYALP